MKNLTVACSVAALLATVVPLQARQRAPDIEAETFRQRLVDALARGDRKAVAGMVRYRLIVNAGGLQVPVVNQAALINMWDIVFPPVVRCVIEQSGVPKPGQPQPRYTIETDAAGVTLGNRSIRADRGPGGLKISEITLPPGYGLGTGGKPQRVLFKWGKGRMKYAGSLAADNVDVYLVQARKGDLLNAQLERVRTDRASLRVVHGGSDRVLTPTAPGQADAQRGWAGAVQEAGEYRVEVVRRGAYCDPPVTYQLTISLE